MLVQTMMFYPASSLFLLVARLVILVLTNAKADKC